MTFSVNSPVLFILFGTILAVVLAQSIYFLVKAIRRAKEKNMDMAVIKKTITSAAIFTIAPATAILVGVITLSKSLGIPLPWLRLSIIGSLSYETIAAGSALGPLGLDTATTITEAGDYVTVMFVMTVGIIIGILVVPLLTKKLQSGMVKIEQKDKKWAGILNTAMFMGMISAFLGYVFCDVTNVFKGDLTGLVPVFVMIVSALIMAVLGILSKKTNARWIQDYALTISLVGGMAAAIPITNWLG